MVVHFVGVAADQHDNAVRLWGRPAFTHPRASWRAMGDIDGSDTIVMGRDAFKGGRPKAALDLIALVPTGNDGEYRIEGDAA